MSGFVLCVRPPSSNSDLWSAARVADSYANRTGKGTHQAIERLRSFAGRYRYVLQADIVQHFASIDHAILLAILRRQIAEPDHSHSGSQS